ncbi:MAG: hypothetical protein ACYC7G_08335 [Rudaea sp.]
MARLFLTRAHHDMQRSLFLTGTFLTGALLVASATAQTTIDLTNQAGTATCSYPTGVISSSITTPGHLAAQLTGTPSGAGCSSGSSVPAVSFGPASPLAASSTSIAGGTAVADTFTMLPLNAVSCSAAISTTSGSGSGTLTNGSSVCSTQAACTSTTPFSIPATFTNTSTSATSTYNVTVTCNAASGASPASTSSSVVVTQAVASGGGGGSCPTITGSNGVTSYSRWTGQQTISYYTSSKLADVTSFISVYGTGTGNLSHWPGNGALTAVFPLPTSNYIALQFTVPNNFMAGYTLTSPPLYGEYSINTSGYQAPIGMTISTACGDFSDPGKYPSTSTVVQGCFLNNGVSTTGAVVWFKPGQGTCALQDNHTYYLNIVNADISTAQPAGGGSMASTKTSKCGTGCTDPIANNPGSWISGYTYP